MSKEIDECLEEKMLIHLWPKIVNKFVKLFLLHICWDKIQRHTPLICSSLFPTTQQDPIVVSIEVITTSQAIWDFLNIVCLIEMGLVGGDLLILSLQLSFSI